MNPKRHSSFHKMWLLIFISCYLLAGGQSMFIFSGMKPSSTPQERFVEASNGFSIHLYQHVASISEGNLFLCTFCITSTLTMLMEGARQRTAAELNETLKFKENRLYPDILRPVFTDFNDRFKSSDFFLNTINALFIQQGFDVNSDYKTLGKDVYNTVIKEEDFIGNAPQATWDINEFIKRETENKIRRIFERVESNTRMLLLSLAHFSANTSLVFDDDVVYRGTFYNQGIEDRIVEILQMEKRNEIQRLANSYDFRAMEIPCRSADSAIKLWILLPHKMGYLANVEDGLSTATFRQLKGAFKDVSIDACIPRIKFDFTVNLSKVLQKLGLLKAFSPSTADFGNISQKKGLALSHVIHKGLVDITDGISDLSAVEISKNFTEVIEQTSLGYVPPFEANHPFIFCVIDTSTGLILHMGRVNEF